MLKRKADAPPTGSVSAFAARKTVRETLQDVKNESALKDESEVSHYPNGSPPVKKSLKRPKRDAGGTKITIDQPPRRNQAKGASEKTPETAFQTTKDLNVTQQSKDLKAARSLALPDQNLVRRINGDGSGPHSGSAERLAFEAEGAQSSDSSDLNYRLGEGYHGDSSTTKDAKTDQAYVHRLSTFTLSDSKILNQTETEIVVRLDENDVLTLVGQYDLWVRKGAVSLLGATLHPSSRLHRVYAPSTNALPALRLARNPYGPANQGAEVTIKTCNSRIRMLRQLSPMYAHIWNCRDSSVHASRKSLTSSQRSFNMVGSSEHNAYRRHLHRLDPPPDWQPLISKLVSDNTMARPTVVMVCGPKGSGKSTFCRLLANALISKLPIKSGSSSISQSESSVAFLDADPGQPEFSPPGEISLVQLRSFNFGVPYSHPTPTFQDNKSIRAHHLGFLSMKDDPEHYIRCITNLFEHYYRILTLDPSCPLIINCSGWIQGSGLEALEGLMRHLPLAGVVYTSTQGPTEVVESIENICKERRTSLYCVTSQPVETTSYNAAELRMMQALSYFHLDENELGRLRWDSTPINEMVPLVVPYDGSQQSIFAVCLPGYVLDPEFLITVLEGCIVGIVVIEDDAALSFLTDHPSSSVTDPIVLDPINDGLSSAEVMDVDHDGGTNPRLAGKSNASAFIRPSEELPESQIALNPNNPADFDTSQSPIPSHLYHPSIRRTSGSIPYMPPTNGISLAPLPAHSHSLGQALIRGVDTDRKQLLLVTPVPSPVLQRFHKQRKKIVLVRGKLDTPTWAYKEDLLMRMARTKVAKKEKLYEVSEDEWGRDNVRRWSNVRPWTRCEGRSKGEKLWRVRRDLGKKEKGV